MSVPTFGLTKIFLKSTFISEKNGNKQNYSKRTAQGTDILFHILNDFGLFFQIIDAVMNRIILNRMRKLCAAFEREQYEYKIF